MATAQFRPAAAQTHGKFRTMPDRVNVLGVGVSAVDIGMAVKTIDGWIAASDPHYVCVTGVHGIIESQGDEDLRGIHNRAGLVTPDGMPLVWLSRLDGRSHVDRVYGPDLMLAICERSTAKGYWHFFYGGNEGVPERLRDHLQTRFPGLNVVGTHSPPFRSPTPNEEFAIVEEINGARPDIVWVGLSTPKQERWMARHLGKLNASVLIGVGAAFDYHTGMKKQAPRWMQRSGLEWLFRLLTEPRRLWKRYLKNNPYFVFLVVCQKLGLRHYVINA